MKNTGIPYEQLTQIIFDNILNQSQTETIDVKQNVILQGKTAKHQIDVFWEFEKGGVKYKTIIQAKDWKYRVKQEQLLTFKAILDDLPNQPRGLFITRTGYQKGAKDFAEKNGILLYELREPKDKDFEGRIKNIILTMNAFTPDSKIQKMTFDEEWTSKELLKVGFKEDFNFSLGAHTNEMFLIDDENQDLGSVYDLINSFYPESFKTLEKTRIKKIFDNPTFLLIENVHIKKLKLYELVVDIWVDKFEHKSEFGYEDIVTFILKNVLDDEITTIDKNLKLISN